jgi:hypothetical protein
MLPVKIISARNQLFRLCQVGSALMPNLLPGDHQWLAFGEF